MTWTVLNQQIVPVLLGAGVSAGLGMYWIGGALRAGRTLRLFGAVLALGSLFAIVSRVSIAIAFDS